MRFANPLLLNLLFLLPLLALFYAFSFRSKRRAKERWGRIELIERISSPLHKGIFCLKLFLLFGSIFFLILALSRPQWGKKPIKVMEKGEDIVFCIDTSLSMDVQDIKPSRLKRAKEEIKAMLERMRGHRIGLVAFAGKSFIECPLTLDYCAFRIFLDVLNSQLIPQPGTDLEGAIKTALSLLTSREARTGADKAIILVTDGEGHQGDPLVAARIARRKGVRIYPLGMATVEGGLIPLYNEQGEIKGYKRDKQGSLVVSKLNEPLLQQIAEISRGNYYRFHSGEGFQKVFKAISSLRKQKYKEEVQVEYRDRYQYFVFIAFLFLSVEFLLTERR